MAVNAHQTVVCIFDNRSLADNAVDGLQNAGFSPDQIYYAGSGDNPGTDFWHGIKSLFSRDRAISDDDVAGKLKELGLSDDEIRYYKNEYDLGRAIVAVNAPGRAEEALTVLHTNGGHK